MKKSEPEDRPLCESSAQLAYSATSKLGSMGYVCTKSDETYVQSQDQDYKVKVKRIYCTHSSKSPMVLIPQIAPDNESNPSCFHIVGTLEQINEHGTSGLQ